MSTNTSKLDAWLDALGARADALKAELQELSAREEAVRKSFGDTLPSAEQAREACQENAQLAELTTALQRQAEAEGRDRAARAKEELDALRGKDASHPSSVSRRKDIIRL